MKIHLSAAQKAILRQYAEWAAQASLDPTKTLDARQKLADMSEAYMRLLTLDMSHSDIDIMREIKRAF